MDTVAAARQWLAVLFGPPCRCDRQDAGASKGTPGDAKFVTEILGGTKIRKLGGTKFKIVATRCHILRLKCTKFDFGWGPPQIPLGELTALPQTL